jgi:hypothetical protein
LVEDLFGEGTDEGLAAELTSVLFVDAGDDLVDVQGLASLGEDGLDQGDTGPGRGQDLGTFRRGAAEQAQGAELGMGGSFEDLDEVLAMEKERILFHGLTVRDNVGICQ